MKITDRPCCDNCPHYDADGQVLTVVSAMSLVLGEKPEYTKGGCLFEQQWIHTTPEHRCGNHPFIAAMVSSVRSQSGTGSAFVGDWSREFTVYVQRIQAIREDVLEPKEKPCTT